MLSLKGSPVERRVLVVDDEEPIVAGLTAVLEFESIETAGAYDRASASAMITDRFYPVIIADLRLGTEEEGLLLLEEIRRVSPESRVLVLTGYATASLENAVLERGAVALLRKPMEGADILAAVNELLAELEQLAGGDEVDLEELYVKARRVLFSIPLKKYRLTAEQAEDVVQEAWLLYLEKRGLIRKPRPWLAATVVNLCRRQIDRIRVARDRFADAEALMHVVDGRQGKPEHALALHQAMERIDGRSRILCLMIGVDGRAYAEVSDSTGLPIGSVGPLYIRAKAKLRKALDHQDQASQPTR